MLESRDGTHLARTHTPFSASPNPPSPPPHARNATRANTSPSFSLPPQDALPFFPVEAAPKDAGFFSEMGLPGSSGGRQAVPMFAFHDEDVQREFNLSTDTWWAGIGGLRQLLRCFRGRL